MNLTLSTFLTGDLSISNSYEVGKKYLNGDQAMVGGLVIAFIAVAPTIPTGGGAVLELAIVGTLISMISGF